MLCPRAESQSATSCKGDYTISEGILRAAKFSDEDIIDVFEVMKSRGGFCDCEILYNAVENSRLKSNYWRAHADDAAVPNPHGGRHSR
jgi:hypothetical protein